MTRDSTRVLTAHQLGFLPWLGFFDKLAQADVFCIFDAVAFEHRGFINRNWIKTRDGPLLLTVPVRHENMARICDVEIAAGSWARKHMRSIELAYRKATHFEQHFAGIGAVIDLYAQGGNLMELNADLLRYFMRTLGLQRQVVKASDYEFRGTKAALVLDMCKQLGASEYIFGANGRSYADPANFIAAGVVPRFQDYRHPSYPQLHGEFVPNLSVLDLLMNCGVGSLELLRNREEAPA